jgi:hypothetical protein
LSANEKAVSLNLHRYSTAVRAFKGYPYHLPFGILRYLGLALALHTLWQKASA